MFKITSVLKVGAQNTLPILSGLFELNGEKLFLVESA
jgi:hypothetical protein